MLKPEIHIFIFSLTEVIAEGLHSILSKVGFDPIMVSEPKDFYDYPNILGSIIIILPRDLYEREYQFFNVTYKPGNAAHYLHYNLDGNRHDEINLADSAVLIQHKVRKLVDTLNAENTSDSRHELTQRELEVLKLVALGYTNKEIAEALFISAHTVISHRKNISEKTGIKTISGLTMLAVLKKVIDINEIEAQNLK